MFTGIVSALGEITQVLESQSGGGVRVVIEAPYSILSDVKPGDSIAVQGACMTVIDIQSLFTEPAPALHAAAEQRVRFAVDVSLESLACTVGLNRLGEVNIEPALRVGDRLGGHWVSGHVDGIGEVIDILPCGESQTLRLRIPVELAGYVAAKGSLTVNGVSLTVNQVKDEGKITHCSINLIPHTLEHTTLKGLQAGDKVNLEIDLMARYMARLLQYHS